MRLARSVRLLLLALAGPLGAATAAAEDFSAAKVEKKWKVTLYRANGTRPGQTPSTSLPQGGVGMAFTPQPNTALLTTIHPSYRGDLLGDLTGATTHAEIAVVDADAPAYNFYPDGCTRPANVRLYLRTLDRTLGESQYWWAADANIDLATLTAQGAAGATFDVALAPSGWSDRMGHRGDSAPEYAAAFAAAVADVAEIGLSFGGGCHYAFGVGLASGSATFQLRDFSVVR